MNAPTNTGGPAFPNLIKVGELAVSEGGLTARDYFAAHAPKMPSWFRCKPSRPRPEIPSATKELEDDQQREWRGIDDCDDREVSPEVLEFSARYQAAQSDLLAWQEEQKAHAFIAWRWHYADMMVRAREAS